MPIRSRKNRIKHLQALFQEERALDPLASERRLETNMADDPKKQALDRKLIALNEPYEVQYWKETFHVSEQELRDAVAAIGHSAAEVRAYLKKK